MRLLDMIFYWSRAEPHRAAVVQPEMVTTYQALADAIESIGERIKRLGIRQEEPIAVSIANPSFFIATVFALVRAGYSPALINPALFPLLQSAGLRNLIYDAQGQVLSGGRNVRFDPTWLPGGERLPEGKPFESRRESRNPHMIFFTSGTTGLPKKIVQAEAALDRLLSYAFTCASGGHEKILVMPGLATTFGFNRVCEALNVGKTVCFASGSEAALSLIGLFGVEMVVASPAQILLLVDAKLKNPDLKLESLKAVLVGGGKVEPDSMARIRALLCRNVLSQYGSTEAGVTALAPFDLLARTPGAVGFVLPWTDLQIVDDSGEVLAAGLEGLVRYRTPQLMENLRLVGPGNIPGVQDGWFYPGDIGYVNAEGVLCLTGRSSDVINRGGVKVSGTRIEEILSALPGVKEVAACGVAGEHFEEIWIAIVPDGSIDVEDISRYLREHKDIGVAADQVFLLDAFPRGELGKIQKPRLKELLRHRSQAR